MREVLRVVNQLSATSSRTDKESILKQNADNQLLKDILQFVYDSFIVTGLSSKKINKDTNLNPYVELNTIQEVMNYLKTNNTGRDIDIANVHHFIYRHNKELQEFFKKVVTKELKTGVTAKTLNKVYGKGFIKEFSVMLAKKFDEHQDKVKGDFVITEKLDGCFEGNMKVNMADGTYKKIKNIKTGDFVLSFNEKTNEVQPKRVINVFKNGKKPIEQWYKIQLRNFSGRYCKRIIATYNHKFFTEYGWDIVENIKNGDKIYIYDYIPSYEQEQVLLGTILGDTNINKEHIESRFGRFQLRRTNKKPHLELFNKQKELFSNFIFSSGEVVSGYGSKMNYANINAISSLPKYFYNSNNIRKSSYKLNKEILDNLDALGLAMFYLDDGSKRACKEDGDDYISNIAPRCSFSLYKFPYEEIVNFQKYLKNKFNIDSKIIKDKILKNGKQSYRLDINKDSTEIFFDLIAKYVPKEMRYKLGIKWREVEEYKWWEYKGKYDLILEEVLNISKYKNKYKKSINAYDLEIEDNHTYIIEDFAVHNCRIIALKDNGVVKSFSRQGKQYEGLEEIESDIANLPMDNIVFDGELIADIQGSTLEVYAETTSKARSKGSNKTGLLFHIFDMLPLDEFQNGQSKEKCVVRKQKLSKLFAEYDLPHCREVKPLYIGSDLSKISEWMKYASEQGWEGLMVNLDRPYICKRSDHILKVKTFNDSDVRVLNVLEGTGKNQNKLGAITIQFEHQGQLYECNCGSGFSDEERDLYWNNPELIVGKIVTVGYFEISKNQDNSYGLRFPTWKGIIRHDKDEISMN